MLAAEPICQPPCLVLADRVKRRIGVTVGQLRRIILACRPRLAVTDEQKARCARRRGKSVLAVLNGLLTHLIGHTDNATLARSGAHA